MKSRLVTAVALTSLIAAPAFAGGNYRYTGASGASANNVSYDYATVIESAPIFKVVRVSTPREECWEENVVYRDRGRDGSGVGTVVGGVVGGALGNAVGHKKRNKQVGAVVGAVLGATVGNAIAANSSSRQREYYDTEEVCRVYQDYHEEERIMGYDVRYRYNNETYSTRMNTDPGDTIRIRLSVSPAI